MKPYDFSRKSTVEEIRKKFDLIVDRFADSKTGQVSAVDSTLIIELIAASVNNIHPKANEFLDIGCGAGNYSLQVLSKYQNISCTLLDLSGKMLNKAKVRLSALTSGMINTIQADIRQVELPDSYFDFAIAATSLHHLRAEDEWELVFKKVYDSLKPGGSFWISDIIIHDNEEIQYIMWNRYGQYMVDLVGKELRDWAFEQIEIEDTPRSMNFQIDLLLKTGFKNVEILHKNMNFAAFGGIK